MANPRNSRRAERKAGGDAAHPPHDSRASRHDVPITVPDSKNAARWKLLTAIVLLGLWTVFLIWMALADSHPRGT